MKRARGTRAQDSTSGNLFTLTPVFSAGLATVKFSAVKASGTKLTLTVAWTIDSTHVSNSDAVKVSNTSVICPF